MKKASLRKSVYWVAILTLVYLMVFSGPACKKKSSEKPAEKKGIQAEEKAPPPKAKTGQGLIISCLPRDGQKVLSLEQPIFVLFSQSIKPEDFSFAMKPDPGGWARQWRDDGKHVSLEHANPFQAGKKYELELSAKAPSQKLVVRFRAFGEDSLQLIDEDAKKGLLDLDTAWTYRLQTLFEPERLPEKYQSPTPMRCGTPVMVEFRKVRNRLRPETLEKLKPYLVRPTDPASIYSSRIAKSKKTADHKSQPGSGLLYAEPLQRPPSGSPNWAWPPPERTDKYSVWDWQDPGMAKTVAGIIASWSMWDKFTSLMAIEPPSDVKDPDNGGDGTLDIYVVPPSEHLQNAENPNGCVWGICVPTEEERISPSYIIIDGTLTGIDFNATLAHELFHSFQDAYNADSIAEDQWWGEGSAEWSVYFIDRSWYEFVQDWNPKAFNPDEHMLKTLTSSEDHHAYAIYLFPFYLAKKNGNEIIGTIWQYCQNQGSLDAVNSALQGKFDECFKQFALMNWDQDTDYEGKETYPEEVDAYSGHGYDQVVDIPTEMPYQKEIELPPLSAKYRRFRNSIKDPKDRDARPHIRFDLRKFKENQKLTVQAIIFFIQEGRYKFENWTGKEERSFCINRDDENFDRIILVLGNADREKTLTPELDVYLNDMECDDCYAKIKWRDFSEHRSWGANRRLTQIWEKEAAVYVSFEPGIFSATPGQDAQILNMPYGSTIYQGKALKVLDFKARDFTEIISSRGVERKEKKGDHAEIVMPSIPVLPIEGPDKQPLQFRPYPLLTVYFEAQTGKVKYALVPEVEIKFLWDGKEPDYFTVKSLTQGESSQSVKIQGMGSLKKIFQVKSGDGVEIFGGDGEYSWQNRSSGTSEDKKQTYKWEIHRKKSDKK